MLTPLFITQQSTDRHASSSRSRMSSSIPAPSLPPLPEAAPPRSSSSRPTSYGLRRGLAALGVLVFVALGVVRCSLLVGGGGSPDEPQERSGAVPPPARSMLGPRAQKEASQQMASPPRCCTTEYGQADAPQVAMQAAVLGAGTPGHWGGFGMNDAAPAADAASNSSSSTTINDSAGPAGLDGVAYLVVTAARDDIDYVEGLLARLDAHFGRLHPAYPLVLFLAGTTALAASGEEEARLRAAMPHTRLDVRSVEDLQQKARAAEAAAAAAGAEGMSSAAAMDAAWAYARSLWEFRVAAPRLLAGEHEWVLQLSEETLLDEDVTMDPFLALKQGSRKLGYMTAHRSSQDEGLWAYGRAFAQQHQTPPDAAFHLTKNVPKRLDGRWIALHRSVVAANEYQALIVGVASSNLTTQPPPPPQQSPQPASSPAKAFVGSPTAAALQRQPGGLLEEAALEAGSERGGAKDATMWSAAGAALPEATAVLTLGALLGLRPADFVQFQGITLQRPPPKPLSTTPPLEGAPGPGSGNAEEVETVSQWRDFRITARAAGDLQPLFDVRREGWLGADVATSFRMPPKEQGEGDGAAEGEQEGRYLWLFGDTLLGRSSARRRKPGAFFIHNSVAFLPAYDDRSGSPPPKPEDVVFAWNVSRGGCPVSVFVRQERDDECRHEQGAEYLWPISGMGVSYNGTAKVVVLAVRWAYTSAPGAGVDLFADDPFNFRVLGSTVLVVDNPHDPPQAWRYRQKDIPGTDGDFNWYSAMLHERKGAELATGPDDRIYLFGVNTTVAPGLSPPQQWQYETLARLPVRSLVDLSFDGMEVWAERERGGSSGSDSSLEAAGAPHWVPYSRFLRRREQAAPLIFPVFSETSVRYSKTLGAYYGVVVDWLSTTVLLYIAEEVTGPWEAVPCYKLPPPFDDPSLYMSYAGKAHPELARGRDDDEIILTYLTNAPGDLAPLFEAGALDVYVPRFVRVKLERTAPAVSSSSSLPMASPAKRRVV